MTKLNMQNRTLGIMDNLPFLRSLNNECIDLIAIDPPFAANATFKGMPKPSITQAELQEERVLAAKNGVPYDEGVGETRVEDIWTWNDDVHPDWLNKLEDDYPAVFAVVKAVESCADENKAAYIAFMAVRLIECRRVLKPTGSIWIHCDHHANSYLRLLMDAVFGQENFRNEITWPRYAVHSLSGGFDNISDTLLCYSVGDDRTQNTLYRPLGKEELEERFPHTEPETGRRYQRAALEKSSNAYSAGETRVIDGRRVTSELGWIWTQETFDERIAKNPHLIYWTRNGKPRYKIYADEYRGVPLGSIWTDIPYLPSGSSERTGYATQKPLSLYQRIIEASSNSGDVVLDAFAGCATTAVAAERLGRQWIACDIAYRSWTMLKRRFAMHGYALSDMTSATTDALSNRQPELTNAKSYTIGPSQLPARDDEDPQPFHNLQRVKRGQKKSVRSASWSGRMTKEEAKQLLIDKFGPHCWGCGWEAPKFPNGEYDLGLLEVDHIWARRDPDTHSGGSDELYNLAILHATCNRTKGNRLTLEELRQQNADDQRLYRKPGDLVHLGEATQFATEYILQRGTQSSWIPNYTR